ncbi:MAG: hypothetical protein ACRDWH_02945 [Acidimicrobiia bacterium]
MNRREFLTIGAGSAALAVFPAIPAVAADNRHPNFNFLTIGAHTGGTDMLAMSGDGTTNPARVIGGGSWNHFDNDPALPIPKPVIGTGTWKSGELVSLDIIGTWGVLAAGTLVMEARFLEESGLRFSATVTVNCNLGFAGLSTGLPEGVFVDIPDFGISFVPATFPGTSFPFGLTVFSTADEQQG